MLLYGKLRSEEIAEQNVECRKIVNEIMNFGVTQRQIWVIMHNLALELESIDEMRACVAFFNEAKGDQMFLSALDSDSAKDSTHG